MKIKVVDIIKKIGADEPQKITVEPVVEKKEPARNASHSDAGGPVKELTKETLKPVASKEKTEILQEMVAREKVMEEAAINRKKSEKTIDLLAKPKRRRGFWFYFLIIFILGAGGSFAYSAVNILPRAEIKIVTKKADWKYENSIRTDSKIGEIDVVNRQIPAAAFSQQKKNLTILWLATGKKYIERKASGKITMFNAYSSGQQIFVAGTRFKAPDGKIFKSISKITVPGAKIENGKIVPSSVEADIAAEKAGEAYNIGMISKFTIPGLEGTDKYDKFYAESKTALVGGVVGEVPYPNDADISKAKEAARAQIKEAIEGLFYVQIASENFKVIEQTKQFNILKEVVNKDTDSAGNFSVYIEADASAQAFKESSLLDLMSALAIQVIGADFKLKDYKIDYKGAEFDAKNKTAVLSINFQGNFWKPVQADDFIQKITGKSESDLKALIFSSEIEKADISFWPFWVNSVPANSNKIKLTIE